VAKFERAVTGEIHQAQNVRQALVAGVTSLSQELLCLDAPLWGNADANENQRRFIAHSSCQLLERLVLPFRSNFFLDSRHPSQHLQGRCPLPHLWPRG
jgi:hypothetical protein